MSTPDTSHASAGRPALGTGLRASVDELIGLLHDALDSDGGPPLPDDVRALRRVLRGTPRAEDVATLAHRFPGARLCLVAAPPSQLAVVRADLSRAPTLLVDGWGDGLVVLVPALPRDAAPEPRHRVTRTIARVHRAAPTARVGVSGPLEQVGQAARGMDEAERARQLSGPGQAVLADDRWFDIALSRLRDSIRDSLAVDGPLSRLDDGSRPGTDLRTSLATWLAADGDVRTAAAQLHLHPNSLRYRLRRATELTGIDLTDPLQRVVALLALTSD